MQSFRFVWIGLFVSLSLAGCGGDDHGTGPLTATAARELCRVGCEYDASCDPAVNVEACTSACGTVGAGYLREDAAFALSDCKASLACTEDDDVCVEKIEPLDVHHRWEERCGTQLAAACDVSHDDMCNVDPTEGEDHNALVTMAAPAVVEELIACLDLADCEARLTCVNAVFGRLFPDE